MVVIGATAQMIAMPSGAPLALIAGSPASEHQPLAVQARRPLATRDPLALERRARRSPYAYLLFMARLCFQTPFTHMASTIGLTLVPILNSI